MSLFSRRPIEVPGPLPDIRDSFSKNCLEGCHGHQSTQAPSFDLGVFASDLTMIKFVQDDDLSQIKLEDLRSEISKIVKQEGVNTKLADDFDLTKPSTAELALEEMIQEGTAQGELQVVLDTSYDEKDIEIYKQALEALREERLNPDLNKMIEVVRAKSRSNTSVDQELLLDRALVNLTDDPKYLFKYFPALAKKLEQGLFDEASLSREIRAVASNIKGAYLGNGHHISDSDARYQRFATKVDFDHSTKYLLAASWLSTRPADEYAKSTEDDISLIPKKIYTVSGVLGDRVLGRNYNSHTIVQSFKNLDSLNTATHELLHARDEKSNGYSYNYKKLPGLIDLRDKFAQKIRADEALTYKLFQQKTQSVLSRHEMTAFTHTSFLLGDASFADLASETELPKFGNFYQALVRYYGVDPLSD